MELPQTASQSTTRDWFVVSCATQAQIVLLLDYNISHNKIDSSYILWGSTVSYLECYNLQQLSLSLSLAISHWLKFFKYSLLNV